MCWELRFRGALQWHAEANPFSAETYDRAHILKICVRIRMEPAMRCKFFKTSAVCSVACLEWQRWIADQALNAPANASGLLPFETVSAKEAKSRTAAVEEIS